MAERKSTRQQLLEDGMQLLLEHGYNDLGIQTLLQKTGVPKGSFYHHFASKQAFALEAVDQYMDQVHEGLTQCLTDRANPPLARVKRFFELSRDKYAQEGHLGCLLGNLGQELAAINPTFSAAIEHCFETIAGRLSGCLREAQKAGALDQSQDPDHLANLLLNCWEGAALRSRLQRDPAALNDILDFYFGALGTAPTAQP